MYVSSIERKKKLWKYDYAQPAKRSRNIHEKIEGMWKEIFTKQLKKCIQMYSRFLFRKRLIKVENNNNIFVNTPTKMSVESSVRQ